MRKYLKALIVAAVAAVALVVFLPQSAHADDGFYNCVTYWWYTDCSWIDLEQMAAESNSFGFEAVYAFCKLIGLCP